MAPATKGWAGPKGPQRVLKIDRTYGRRVLRFDGALGAEGCGGRCAAMSIYAACGGRWWAPFNSCKAPLMIKPDNRPAGVGNTPLFPLCGTSPGGGSLLSSIFSANLSCSFYSIARTSPSGGGAVGRRDAFPTVASPVCLFFQRPPGRL